MRYVLIALLFMSALVAGTKVWAFVSASDNIAKENGYAVLKPPSGKVVIGKQSGYAVLTTPTGVVIAKASAYAVLAPLPGDAKIAKENGYAIIVPRSRLPTVQILQ